MTMKKGGRKDQQDISLPGMADPPAGAWPGEAVATPSTAAEADSYGAGAYDDEDEEDPMMTACRESWKRSWANMAIHEVDQKYPEPSGSFTRWLSPSVRPHERDRLSGVQNQWKHQAWSKECRARWWSQMPKHMWRSAPPPLHDDFNWTSGSDMSPRRFVLDQTAG
mmetsp:Transcript_110039/g.206303  ORF Transcript_110039/g.206303 Transcript_110039/m.206303 type:complete len:166 (-) Transcript_110039:155-652(-)